MIKHLIPKLPQPPASAESAARSWINKHGNALRREYDQWRSRLRPSPATQPPPVPEPSETPTQAARRLGVDLNHPQLQQLRRRPGALVQAIAALSQQPLTPDPTQWVINRIQTS